MEGRNRPIPLKKSAMVSTAEKYAFEIDIFTLSRGFRAQISRSCAQKRRFQQAGRGPSGRTDFSAESARSCLSLVAAMYRDLEFSSLKSDRNRLMSSLRRG
jgi:hypothetical protein